jgi:hypothetical protein
VPQEAHLRCRLQEPRGGLAGTLAQRRLTKRSREYPKGEVRRNPTPRTSVNRGKKRKGLMPAARFSARALGVDINSDSVGPERREAEKA